MLLLEHKVKHPFYQNARVLLHCVSKNQRRWIFKQSCKDSGLCDVLQGRYLKKCYTQIYKALYGDAKFVSLWGAQIWLSEGNKNMYVNEFCYKKPLAIFWGLVYIYMSTYSHTRTVQIVKSQQISHFFLNYVTHQSLEIQPYFITRRKPLSNWKFVKR